MTTELEASESVDSRKYVAIKDALDLDIKAEKDEFLKFISDSENYLYFESLKSALEENDMPVLNWDRLWISLRDKTDFVHYLQLLDPSLVKPPGIFPKDIRELQGSNFRKVGDPSLGTIILTKIASKITGENGGKSTNANSIAWLDASTGIVSYGNVKEEPNMRHTMMRWATDPSNKLYNDNFNTIIHEITHVYQTNFTLNEHGIDVNQRRGAFRSFLETSYVDDAPFRARLTFLEPDFPTFHIFVIY